MKFETTVTIHWNEEEAHAWNVLFLAIRDLAHKPCGDVEVSKAVNDFYEAMQNFVDYIED